MFRRSGAPYSSSANSFRSVSISERSLLTTSWRLFALRGRCFDNISTLSITETVYKGQIRPFGKTRKSLGEVYLPSGLTAELLQWKLSAGKRR